MMHLTFFIKAGFVLILKTARQNGAQFASTTGKMVLPTPAQALSAVFSFRRHSTPLPYRIT